MAATRHEARGTAREPDGVRRDARGLIRCAVNMAEASNIQYEQAWRSCATFASMRSTQRWRFFSTSCSQMRMTVQPSLRNSVACRRSRALFPEIFSRQQGASLSDQRSNFQPCQKIAVDENHEPDFCEDDIRFAGQPCRVHSEAIIGEHKIQIVRQTRHVTDEQIDRRAAFEANVSSTKTSGATGASRRCGVKIRLVHGLSTNNCACSNCLPRLVRIV